MGSCSTRSCPDATLRPSGGKLIRPYSSWRLRAPMKIFLDFIKLPRWSEIETRLVNISFKTDIKVVYPPASKVSREVVNLTWRKNPHTTVYGVKEFVCLSICLSVVKFDLNYLRTGEIEWAEIFFSPIFASKQTFLIIIPLF